MLIDISKYIDILCEHKISEQQFLILWLVHTKDTENIKKYKEKKGQFNILDLQYLVDIGLLMDFRRTEQDEWNIYDLLVTDKFTKSVIIDEEDAYEELVKVYPPWFYVKGTKWPSVKGNPIELTKEYKKCHKNNKAAHERIIHITSTYFKGKYAIAKIEDYIRNRMWNLLETELEKEVQKDNIFKTL
jgi:hypothetical protein